LDKEQEINMKRLVETFGGFSGGITGFMQQANLAQSGNPGVIGETADAKPKKFIKSKRKRKPKQPVV
jgi:hypothetical protein